MPDLAQIARESGAAQADADAHGAAMAAAFLRRRIPELIRAARRNPADCGACTHAPHDQPPEPRHHLHG